MPLFLVIQYVYSHSMDFQTWGPVLWVVHCGCVPLGHFYWHLCAFQWALLYMFIWVGCVIPEAPFMSPKYILIVDSSPYLWMIVQQQQQEFIIQYLSNDASYDMCLIQVHLQPLLDTLLDGRFWTPCSTKSIMIQSAVQ